MEELLQEFGLNRTESKVLLSLLEIGSSSAAMLARRTELKRTTVYSALSELEGLALVQRLKRSSHTVFVALEPEQLVEVLKVRSKNAYEQSLQTLEMLKPRLELFPRRTRHAVGDYEVTYTQSLNGCLQVLQQALRNDYCGIFNPQHAFAGDFDEAAQEAYKANRNSKPFIRDIAIEGPGVADLKRYTKGNPNHEVRTIAGDKTLYTDILLSAGVVNLFNYNPQEPMVIQIRHSDYFKFMMMIFEQVWESSTK